MGRMIAAELRKLQHSKIMWIVVLTPLLLVCEGVGNFVRYTEIWKRSDWTVIIEQAMILFPSMLFPLLITIVTALLARIEYSKNGWKHLLSLPVKREHVYISKLIVVLLLVFLSVAVLIAGMIVGGILVGARGPIPVADIVTSLLLTFVAALPIIAIQFGLSLRFAHIGIPLGIGIGLTMPTFIVANSETFWIYDPWTYPVMAALGSSMDTFSKSSAMYGIAIGLFVLVITIGLYEFKRRDVL